MARGWESKSIEEQINAAEAREADRDKQALSALEIEQRRQKEGLLLERARIVRQIQAAHKRRYLVQLEGALAHVEAELTKLDR
jgi:hypothetical protein